MPGALRLSATVRRVRAVMLAASMLATLSGGALDTWVYLGHGHTFANAQSGNLVLMTVSLSRGDGLQAAKHLISLAAFLAGMFVSFSVGSLLKRKGRNSRTVRLTAEAICLVALAACADRLPDMVVITAVSLIAGIQITSLSRIGGWSFNTGMTTGNLRTFARAAISAFEGDADSRSKALLTGLLSLAFVVGALASAWASPRLHGLTLLAIAAMIGAAATISRRLPDPLPPWTEQA